MSVPGHLPRTAPAMDETFFTAQRRHRRAARVWSALAVVAALGQAIPAAVMLLPVTLGTAVLVTDVLNLVTPTPDLAARIGDVLDRASGGERAAGVSTDTLRQVSAEVVRTAPGELLVAALVPGLLGMVALWWLSQRFLLRDGLGGVIVSAGGRAPDPDDAEEHQLAHVVEEVAIAAGIRTPRLLVLPADVPNAAAFGRGPDSATIAVSRRLLDDLDRDATQGVVAHLVASIANGDLRMRHALLAVFLAYALAADLLIAPFSRDARRRLRAARRLLRGRAGPEEEAGVVRDLLGWHDDEEGTFTVLYGIMWRVAQFWTNLLFVGGLLVLPFRARKYLADATAVQLARTPDGLGRALLHLHRWAKPLPGAEWAAIYAITSPLPAVGEDGLEDAVTLPASLHPPLHKRVARLGRLGFRERPDLPWPQPAPRYRNLRAARAAGRSWPLVLLTGLFSLVVVVFVVVPLLALLVLVMVGGLMIAVELATLFYAAVAVVVVLPLHVLLRFVA